MQLLIASDSPQQGQHIRTLLTRHGLECSDGHVVSLDVAGDRANRLSPELLVMALPPNPAVGLNAVREARAAAPNMDLLVLGPANDPKLILRALHDGADEFLDQAQLENELAGALVRFKAKQCGRSEHKEGGRVIAVLSPSGGSGGSTVAASVAAALAEQHGECGLIDLRLTSGDLASMFDITPTRTVADLGDQLARMDQTLFEQFLVRHRSGVSLLAAPSRWSDAERVTGKVVRRTLTVARGRFRYVVVDLDRTLIAEQVEAAWEADILLLVVRLDYTSVRNARRILDRLVELGIDLQRVRLVVNGYGQSEQLELEQAEAALEMNVTHRIPNDPATVNQAVNNGVPVILSRPSAKVSKLLRDLAMSVNGAHHG